MPVMLIALCGLRFGEAAGLHVHRVDLAREQIVLQETQRRDKSIKAVPKSVAGQRIVPMTEDVVAALRELIGDVAVGHLFLGIDYMNWHRRVFVPAVDRAGLTLPHPTPHYLRHSYGSWLAENSVPPHEIAALIGNSSLRATERYLHAGDGRMARARVALRVRRGIAS